MRHDEAEDMGFGMHKDRCSMPEACPEHAHEFYAAPAQKPWVDLTAEEIDWIKNGNEGKLAIIRVTQAKLKEKNS